MTVYDVIDAKKRGARLSEEQIRFLTREAEKLYTFVFKSYALYSAARDYGNGEKIRLPVTSSRG